LRARSKTANNLQAEDAEAEETLRGLLPGLAARLESLDVGKDDLAEGSLRLSLVARRLLDFAK